MSVDFRIQFTDGFIKLNKLLEPVLSESRLASIPKLVIGQFCRGNDMNHNAILDAAQLTAVVNSQERKQCFMILKIS